MKTIIHVNANTIRSNKKHGTSSPPVTIRRGRSREYAYTVEIMGPSRLVYSPDKPLDCGAKAWVETESEVRAVA